MLYYIYGVTLATFTNIKKCRQNKMNTRETINLLLRGGGAVVYHPPISTQWRSQGREFASRPGNCLFQCDS